MKRRKSAAVLPQLIHIFLVLSLCLNLYFLYSGGVGIGEKGYLSLQELGEIRAPGTYGPADLEVVEGSLTISSAGVKLQNTRVKGDLILTEAVGEGSADIFKVTVEESVLVRGGGENTVVFEDSTIAHLVINKEKGKVGVVLKGNTVVDKVTILGEAALSAKALFGEGRIGELYIETVAEIELEGDFETVCVTEPEARVTFLAGEMKSLCTGEESEGVLIDLKEGAVIDSLLAGAPLEISGKGTMKDISVSFPGLCKISGKVEKISAAGRGIFLEFGAANIDALFVDPSEGTVMIHLPEGAAAGYMEFNGAAEVTGSGTIESVLINAPGTTIEASPGTVELARGIKAMVGGEELPDDTTASKATDKDKDSTGKGQQPKKEEPSPSKPDSPSATPTISISAFTNRVMDPGQSENITFTVTPGDAVLSVTSSNTGVATVSLSGNRLTIKAGNMQGTATVTVKGTKPGHNSCTTTFNVTMDPIEEFKIGEQLPLITVVAVRLKYQNAQDYRVIVGGTELEYMGGRDFGGEVPKDEAKRSNVRVVK